MLGPLRAAGFEVHAVTLTGDGERAHLRRRDIGLQTHIAPGPVDTEMAKQVHDETIRRDYFDAIPLRRYGTVDEIAGAVGYLCSPQAGYVNGQVLAVDGGFDASGVGLPTLRRTS